MHLVIERWLTQIIGPWFIRPPSILWLELLVASMRHKSQISDARKYGMERAVGLLVESAHGRSIERRSNRCMGTHLTNGEAKPVAQLYFLIRLPFGLTIIIVFLDWMSWFAKVVGSSPGYLCGKQVFIQSRKSLVSKRIFVKKGNSCLTCLQRCSLKLTSIVLVPYIRCMLHDGLSSQRGIMQFYLTEKLRVKRKEIRSCRQRTQEVPAQADG